MKLTLEQIKTVTRGVVDIKIIDGVFNFRRFSDAQTEVYRNTNPKFCEKSKATSGINFDFYTDAETFGFHFDIKSASSRKFYYFDVYIDGILVKHFGEADMWLFGGELEFSINELALPERVKAAGFGSDIPDGLHRVTVWLPNLVCAMLSDIRISDGAKMIPVPYDKKILTWGDSITQGYDAQYPSLAYANRVARHFNAYLVNQAIGGEKFAPWILDKTLAFKPDIITVAYGSNDWSMWTPEQFTSGCDAFLYGVAEQYPEVPRFAIIPVWRADYTRVTKVGEFGYACEYIRKKASENGFFVVEGWNLVPHLPDFFGDARLHPNDLGFGEYAAGLISEMEKNL